VIEVACTCGGLPAHDHYMGQGPDERGVWGPVWDLEEVGRVWIDWKEVARALSAPSLNRDQTASTLTPIGPECHG
jgi:hypothetical protein